MEVQERRRRTTLSDQLLAAAALEPVPSSAPKRSTSSSSPNLRDLLKVREEEDLQRQQSRRRRSASVSLGTFLACEKHDLSSPGLAAVTAAAIGSRTLLDIIRDEDRGSRGGGRAYDGFLVGGDNGGHKISWRRAFRERLRIRRVGDPVEEGVSAAGLILPSPALASPSGVALPGDNPVRTGAGGGAPPTESQPPERMAAADLPNEATTSAGDQAEAVNGGEAELQQQTQQVRVSLMALLGETDGQGGGPGFAVSALLEVEEEVVVEQEDEEEGKMQDVKCCVCMVRHKGAAFIPCGHTFCRLCSRELWVSRGSCPLCNGFILEVLDIF